MIHITDKTKCCGCGACAQACKLRCITMTADEEGFLYPQVDAERCVNCGACTQACPIMNAGEVPSEIKVYAARCNDEDTRMTSSSGGVFSLLAEKVLSEGGAVFGAAFADDFSVYHTMVESAEDFSKLKGSKYLQSRTEDTYIQAEKILQSGRAVLYTGTGCQIAGLKRYLKRDYENLYTVDVFCHGVPSPMVWQRYLQEQCERYGGAVCDVSFRCKETGWHGYSIKISFINGEQYSRDHSDDLYIKVFLSDICLRPSCHDCQFRQSKSGADLTIGDAWGIEEWMPALDDDKGTSVVVVNSEKGQRLLTAIMPNMECRAGEAQEILSHNRMYYKSVNPHPNRAKFFAAFAAGAAMEELTALCRKSLWRRGLSFGKRCIKKMLKLCGIRI